MNRARGTGHTREAAVGSVWVACRLTWTSGRSLRLQAQGGRAPHSDRELHTDLGDMCDGKC